MVTTHTLKKKKKTQVCFVSFFKTQDRAQCKLAIACTILATVKAGRLDAKAGWAAHRSPSVRP